MHITCNGKRETLAESVTISTLISRKGLEPQRIVVEVNREIIPRDAWSDVLLAEGDQMEILSFVGGGESGG